MKATHETAKAAFRVEQGLLWVRFADGYERRFHPLWLRESSHEPDNRAPTTLGFSERTGCQSTADLAAGDDPVLAHRPRAGRCAGCRLHTTSGPYGIPTGCI